MTTEFDDLPLFAQTPTPLAGSMARVADAIKPPRKAVKPCDPNIRRDHDEVPRLSNQNEKILAELRKGPVTNHELSTLGILKYTSRISDLRAAGFDVRIKSRDRKTGLVVYELAPSPQEVQG